MDSRRSVLTIATGKQLYLDMALNLARSFFWWHKDSDIQFQLVTDLSDKVPIDLAAKIKIIAIKPGELGLGFTPKLYLDKLAGTGQTLFIDSDCLIFGNLDKIFSSFKGRNVSVVGNYISEGEWFGNVKSICHQFKIGRIPKFNGGIYYLEKGAIAGNVYQRARDIEKRYDEIGFVRLRNRPNDEVIMALAMALENQSPLIDDGTVMSDPQACPGKYKLDVISGKTLMINPPLPSSLHREWYPFEEVSPLIVHFLGSYTQDHPYRREIYRLKKALDKKLNPVSNLVALLTIEYPERIANSFKNTFRAAYHKLFGVRKISGSERVIND